MIGSDLLMNVIGGLVSLTGLIFVGRYFWKYLEIGQTEVRERYDKSIEIKIEKEINNTQSAVSEAMERYPDLRILRTVVDGGKRKIYFVNKGSGMVNISAEAGNSKVIIEPYDRIRENESGCMVLDLPEQIYSQKEKIVIYFNDIKGSPKIMEYYYEESIGEFVELSKIAL